MARRNDSQQDSNTPSRVYKSSDVHKRRVDRKGRKKDAPQNPDLQQPSAPAPDSTDNAPSAPASPNVASGSPGSPDSAVVITPKFGRRSEAQREADERWFAAMRDGGDPRRQATEKIPDQPGNPASVPAGNPESAKGQSAEPPSTAQPETASGPVPAPEQTAQSHSTGEQPPKQGVGPGSSPEAAQESVQEPTQEPASEPDKKAPSKRPSLHLPRKRGARIALIIIAILVVAVGVAAALFAWNRWYRFDDHADMQGEWYVVGSTVPVSIDGSSIHLTDDVTYQYEINAEDKTISYTFGPMKGQGRYWFSDDRQYLVITDGNEFTGAGNTADDLLRTFSDLADKVTGSGLKLPEGAGIIAFSREPDAEALAKQKDEAARKAAEEAAARRAAEEEAARAAAEQAGEAVVLNEVYQEEAPAEQAPDGGTPANEGPQNEAPTNEAPANDGSQNEAPAEEPTPEQAPVREEG